MCFKTSMPMPLALFLFFVAAVTSACQTHGAGKGSRRCILPEYPDKGRYEVAGDPGAKPGDDPEYVYLNVSCDHGYGVVGNNVVLCVQGEWSTTMPQCVRVCYLHENPNMVHFCKRPGSEGFGACGVYEPLETIVKHQCFPGYYNPSDMPEMRCVDGAWTNVAQCVPECGLLSDDESASLWAVFIYRKKQDRNRQICVGNIISPNIVISAAHCFWDSVPKLNSAGYMVGVDMKNDEKFPVKDIKVTDRFQGIDSNFQDDIALVILNQAFIYSRKVRPVCLDFDYSFKKKQLQEGNLGTVAVLPYRLSFSEKFKIQKIPYIPIQKCIENSPPDFRQYVNGDKFCAGRDNGTLIFRGNSGTGLAFPETRQGVFRYFLQGLASTAPRTEEEGVPTDFALFTEIYIHKDFIQDHLATSLPPRHNSFSAMLAMLARCRRCVALSRSNVRG